MSTIRALAKAVRKVNAELPRKIVGMIQNTSDKYIQLNQDDLYFKSIDSLGAPLELYKSVSYAFYKQDKNPNLSFGRPDLKDTGAFYSGFKLDAGYTGVINIYSTDSKSDLLEARYGKFIFGLTPQARAEYAQYVYEKEFKPYFTKATGLQFR